MNLEKYFKPEDRAVADAEQKCIKHLQRLIELNLNAGKVEQARERAIDTLRSIERLMVLNAAKNKEDNLYNLLHQARIDRAIWRAVNEN